MGRGPLQGELGLVDGAAPPRARVGRYGPGLDPDPAHDGVGVLRPTDRGIVHGDDLRAGRPIGVDPRLGAAWRRRRSTAVFRFAAMAKSQPAPTAAQARSAVR